VYGFSGPSVSKVVFVFVLEVIAAELPLALFFMAVCVVIHSAGLAVALRWMHRRPLGANVRYGSVIRVLVCVAGLAVLLHLTQIAVWAFLYSWVQALPDLRSALYFSVVTYTTTGYGDVVLPPDWRLVGGVEALTGILMCGLSTGFFFATAQRIWPHSAVQHPLDGPNR